MDEAEAKLKVKKPEIVEDATIKRPSEKPQKVLQNKSLVNISIYNYLDTTILYYCS